MTKRLKKSLKRYLSKLKNSTQPPLLHFPSNNRLLQGCTHPKTPSFTAVSHQSSDDGAATLLDVDRFLLQNFKSLYEEKNEEHHINETGSKNKDKEPNSNECTFDSPRLTNPPPNLRSSHRFFVAPGSSGSLMEEARLSATTSLKESPISNRTTNPEDFIAVLKYSPTPYNEFRNSMEEMIEARLMSIGKVGWEFMEELLFCYLNLNDKKSYKYVLSAFVDLIVVLRDNSGRIPARSGRGERERDNGQI